jgi:hypothetical protein
VINAVLVSTRCNARYVPPLAVRLSNALFCGEGRGIATLECNPFASGEPDSVPSPGAPVGPGLGSTSAGSLFAPASGWVTEEAVALGLFIPAVIPNYRRQHLRKQSPVQRQANSHGKCESKNTASYKMT